MRRRTAAILLLVLVTFTAAPLAVACVLQQCGGTAVRARLARPPV
jgi:hypothetical protein